MFENIGAKIKKLAKVLCWIGIIGSVIFGIIMISTASALSRYSSDVTAGVLGGIAVIVFGSLFSWIGSFFTYGFGELIETNQQIRNNLCGVPSAPSSVSSFSSDRDVKKAQYKRMLDNGVISQDEYNAKMAAL